MCAASKPLQLPHLRSLWRTASRNSATQVTLATEIVRNQPGLIVDADEACLNSALAVLYVKILPFVI